MALGLRIGRHLRFAPIRGHVASSDPAGAVLPAYHIPPCGLAGERPHGAQHLQTLVAHRLCEERGRRLHRRHREQLEQMVLHHVAQRARRVVIATALLDADRLGDGDLHVIHIAAVPDRLEDAVAEPERHDVLDGLLAEIVIDAVDLRFLGRGEDLLIERARRLEVAAERLFDDDAPPLPRRLVEQPDRSEPLDDRPEQARRRCEIEEDVCRYVSAARQGFGQTPVRQLVVVSSAHVGRRCRQPRRPLGIVRLGREFVKVAANLLAVLLRRQRVAPDADDGELVAEQAVASQVVERRHQLPLGEIAARPEHHDRAGIRYPRRRLRERATAGNRGRSVNRLQLHHCSPEAGG